VWSFNGVKWHKFSSCLWSRMWQIFVMMRPWPILRYCHVIRSENRVKSRETSVSADDYSENIWTGYRPSVAQRVGKGIALLFHDRGTRREWVVSSTLWPHFTTGKDSVPILQEAGWTPGPVWTGGKSRPHGDSIPDRPAHSQSLYRLSYRAHTSGQNNHKIIA